MAVVFRAEDTQLQRLVALKVMKTSLLTGGAARERFLREARATASLDHDHIVPIYQVGEDRGIHFLAMPLLQGESLEDRLRRERRLPLAEVLRVGRETAEGLAAAHARGLVHRDVKPTNIWLEGKGCRVKILDFGLALPTAEAGHITRSGYILGTPAYMSPEQARAGVVDGRSDLFSLGCVLYQMATGDVPFKGSDPLSTLAALATDQPRPPHEVNPALPADFSTLVLRLLARNPAERPGSAEAVVEALAAMEHRQAEARPGAPATQPTAPRPPRGPRLALALTAAGLLLALAFAGYWFAPVVIRIATDRGEIVLQTDDADIEVVIRQGGQVVEVLDRKTRQKVELPAGQYEAAVRGDSGELRVSASRFVLRRGGTQVLSVERRPAWPLDALRREDIPPSELKVAGRGDADRAPAELVAVLGDSRLKHGGWVNAVLFSPDGKTLASGGKDGEVRLWDTATGEQRHTLLGHPEGGASLAFSPDGKTLASGGGDRTIKLWDVATGQEKATLQGHTAGVSGLAFSPDGKTLASGSADQTVRLWAVATGAELRVLSTGHAGRLVPFSPDGLSLVVAGEHNLTRWDVATGRQTGQTVNVPMIEGPAFSPDLRLLATSREFNRLHLLDTATGRERQCLPGHSAMVRCLAFSPDGKLLASGGRDNLVKVWDLATGKELHTLRGHQWSLLTLAFSPDGALLASAGDDGTVRVWDVATGTERLPSRGHTRSVSSVAISPDGRTLASAGYDHTVRLWDAASGAPRAGAPWRTLKDHRAPVSSVAFSPDGQTLASSSNDGTVILWDPASGENRRSLEGHTGFVHSVAWSPDGRTVASGSADLTVRLWDPATGQERRTLRGHTAAVLSVAFSRDGRTIAAGASDDTVKLWDTATGAELRTVRGGRVAFSPDGKTLATTVHADHTVKLWDAGTGEELLTFHGLSAEPATVAFSPDGQSLAAAGFGGTVYVWDLAHTARRPRTVPLAAGVLINQVAFSPEGRHLAAANNNGTVCILRLAPPHGGDNKSSGQ
jgi:WD40 repeat protein